MIMTPVLTAETGARGRRSMSQSYQQEKQQAKRPARSVSSKALHQQERSKREDEPSAADKERHAKLQEYFQSNFSEEPVNQAPKVSSRGNGTKCNLSVGSSNTSVASASTAPTTPEAATKVQRTSGQPAAPPPLPDSRRPFPVQPAAQNARGCESPRLPQLSQRPVQAVVKIPGKPPRRASKILAHLVVQGLIALKFWRRLDSRKQILVRGYSQKRPPLATRIKTKALKADREQHPRQAAVLDR